MMEVTTSFAAPLPVAVTASAAPATVEVATTATPAVGMAQDSCTLQAQQAAVPAVAIDDIDLGCLVDLPAKPACNDEPASTDAPASSDEPATTPETTSVQPEVPTLTVVTCPGPAPEPAVGLSVSSVGDPHETTGDGLKFDNQKRGDFVKLASASGDFVLQTRQDAFALDSAVTVNTAMAVKLGRDVVAYDAAHDVLQLNGRPLAMRPGQRLALPDGGVVARTATGFELTSPKGDRVVAETGYASIDLHVALAATRADGEVRGSLGVVDADVDASNDMVDRAGRLQAATPAGTDAFLESWRVQPQEALIPAAWTLRAAA